MSEYGFGYYDGDPNDLEPGNGQPDPNQQVPPQQQQAPEPKWFRDYMKKSQAEIQELREKLTSKEIAEQFGAKGYDPAAAALYKGDPTKVDEWLTANGALLARRPGAEQQEENPPPVQQQGPPASTVSSEHQEQLNRMAAAGTGGAPNMGGDAEIAAALRNAKTIEEFEQVANANGWGYSTDGLFG